MYAGDTKIYIELLNFLLSEGFKMSGLDVIHIGDNKYEFHQVTKYNCGCGDYYTILCWKEGEKLKYEKRITGNYCID